MTVFRMLVSCLKTDPCTGTQLERKITITLILTFDNRLHLEKKILLLSFKYKTPQLFRAIINDTVIHGLLF